MPKQNPIKALHLLSNWRWTERSEVVADLVSAEKKAGHASQLICGQPPEDCKTGTVVEHSRKKGVEPIQLEMTKHLRVLPALRDLPKIRRILCEQVPHVTNCHMPNAHLLGAVAHHLPSPDRPLLVRTSYEADGPEFTLRSKLLFKRDTDGLAVLSNHAKKQAAARFGFPEDRIAVIEPGVDLERFNTNIPRTAARARFHILDDDFVVGMASRIQSKRRIDLLLKAATLLKNKIPRLKLLIIGKGKPQQEVLTPARQMGIADRIILPGYQEGANFVSALRAMDVFYFPVGGTDESCRTVREAMASGCATIGGLTGFIPELVEEGKTGLLTDLSPETTAERIWQLYTNRDLLTNLQVEAARSSQKRFPLALQAKKSLSFYRHLLHSTSEVCRSLTGSSRRKGNPGKCNLLLTIGLSFFIIGDLYD